MASDKEVSCICDPNFAVICSFLEKFAASCGINHPNFLELQEMLENSQEVPQPLMDLHIKLLRKSRKNVSQDRWEKALIKFCHTYSNQDGWEIERFGYKKARLTVKLRVLKTLLEQQFDSNSKFKSEVNKLSAEELRIPPLGRDKLGQTYWCQLDDDCSLRVYREDLDEETWDVVAKNREGLVKLMSQLSSNDPLNDDLDPVLNEDSNSLEIEKPITDTGQAEFIDGELKNLSGGMDGDGSKMEERGESEEEGRTKEEAVKNKPNKLPPVQSDPKSGSRKITEQEEAVEFEAPSDSSKSQEAPSFSLNGNTVTGKLPKRKGKTKKSSKKLTSKDFPGHISANQPATVSASTTPPVEVDPKLPIEIETDILTQNAAILISTNKLASKLSSLTEDSRHISEKLKPTLHTEDKTIKLLSENSDPIHPRDKISTEVLPEKVKSLLLPEKTNPSLPLGKTNTPVETTNSSTLYQKSNSTCPPNEKDVKVPSKKDDSVQPSKPLDNTDISLDKAECLSLVKKTNLFTSDKTDDGSSEKVKLISPTEKSIPKMPTVKNDSKLLFEKEPQLTTTQIETPKIPIGKEVVNPNSDNLSDTRQGNEELAQVQSTTNDLKNETPTLSSKLGNISAVKEGILSKDQKVPINSEEKSKHGEHKPNKSEQLNQESSKTNDKLDKNGSLEVVSSPLQSTSGGDATKTLVDKNSLIDDKLEAALREMEGGKSPGEINILPTEPSIGSGVTIAAMLAEGLGSKFDFANTEVKVGRKSSKMVEKDKSIEVLSAHLKTKVMEDGVAAGILNPSSKKETKQLHERLSSQGTYNSWDPKPESKVGGKTNIGSWDMSQSGKVQDVRFDPRSEPVKGFGIMNLKEAGIDLSSLKTSTSLGERKTPSLDLSRVKVGVMGMDLSAKKSPEIIPLVSNMSKKPELKVTHELAGSAGVCDLSTKKSPDKITHPPNFDPAQAYNFGSKMGLGMGVLPLSMATDLSTRKMAFNIAEYMNTRLDSRTLGGLTQIEKLTLLSQSIKPNEDRKTFLPGDDISRGVKRDSREAGGSDSWTNKMARYVEPSENRGSGSLIPPNLEVGEAIEEPLMLVRGEGSGRECDTGNPAKDTQNSTQKAKDADDTQNNRTQKTKDADDTKNNSKTLTGNSSSLGNSNENISFVEGDSIGSKSESEKQSINAPDQETVESSKALANIESFGVVSSLEIKQKNITESSIHGEEKLDKSVPNEFVQNEKMPIEMSKTQSMPVQKEIPNVCTLVTSAAENLTIVDRKIESHGKTEDKAPNINSPPIRLNRLVSNNPSESTSYGMSRKTGIEADSTSQVYASASRRKNDEKKGEDLTKALDPSNSGEPLGSLKQLRQSSSDAIQYGHAEDLTISNKLGVNLIEQSKSAGSFKPKLFRPHALDFGPKKHVESVELSPSVTSVSLCDTSKLIDIPRYSSGITNPKAESSKAFCTPEISVSAPKTEADEKLKSSSHSESLSTISERDQSSKKLPIQTTSLKNSEAPLPITKRELTKSPNTISEESFTSKKPVVAPLFCNPIVEQTLMPSRECTISSSSELQKDKSLLQQTLTNVSKLSKSPEPPHVSGTLLANFSVDLLKPSEAPLPVTKRFLQSVSKSPTNLEESDKVSPTKTPPKLWSIEAICASDDKTKGVADKSGASSSPLISSSVIDSSAPTLAKQEKMCKWSLGIQVIKKSQQDEGSPTTKKTSRWDVGKPTLASVAQTPTQAAEKLSSSSTIRTLSSDVHVPVSSSTDKEITNKISSASYVDWSSKHTTSSSKTRPCSSLQNKGDTLNKYENVSSSVAEPLSPISSEHSSTTKNGAKLTIQNLKPEVKTSNISAEKTPSSRIDNVSVEIKQSSRIDNVNVETKPSLRIDSANVETKPSSRIDNTSVETKLSSRIDNVSVETKPSSRIDIVVETKPSSKIDNAVETKPSSGIENVSVEKKLSSKIENVVETIPSFRIDNASVETKPSSRIDNFNIETKSSSKMDNVSVETKPSSRVDNLNIETKHSSRLDNASVETKPSSRIDTAIVETKPSSRIDNVSVETKPSYRIDNASVKTKLSSRIHNVVETKSSSRIDSVSVETKPSLRIDSANVETKPSSRIDNASVETKPSSRIDNASVETKSSSRIDNASVETKPSSRTDNASVETKPSSRIDTAIVEIKPSSRLDILNVETKHSSRIDNVIDETKPSSRIDNVIVETKPSSRTDNVSVETKPSFRIDNVSVETKPSSRIDNASVETKPSSRIDNASVKTKPSSRIDNASVESKPSSRIDNASVETKPSSRIDNASVETKPSSKIDNASFGTKPSSRLDNISIETKTSSRIDNVRVETKPSSKIDNVRVETKPSSRIDNASGETKPSSRIDNASVETKPSSRIDNASVETKPSSRIDNASVETKPSSRIDNASVETKPSSRIDNASVETKPSPRIDNASVETKPSSRIDNASGETKPSSRIGIASSEIESSPILNKPSEKIAESLQKEMEIVESKLPSKMKSVPPKLIPIPEKSSKHLNNVLVEETTPGIDPSTLVKDKKHGTNLNLLEPDSSSELSRTDCKNNSEEKASDKPMPRFIFGSGCLPTQSKTSLLGVTVTPVAINESDKSDKTINLYESNLKDFKDNIINSSSVKSKIGPSSEILSFSIANMVDKTFNSEKSKCDHIGEKSKGFSIQDLCGISSPEKDVLISKSADKSDKHHTKSSDTGASVEVCCDSSADTKVPNTDKMIGGEKEVTSQFVADSSISLRDGLMKVIAGQDNKELPDKTNVDLISIENKLPIKSLVFPVKESKVVPASAIGANIPTQKHISENVSSNNSFIPKRSTDVFSSQQPGSIEEDSARTNTSKQIPKNASFDQTSSVSGRDESKTQATPETCENAKSKLSSKLDENQFSKSEKVSEEKVAAKLEKQKESEKPVSKSKITSGINIAETELNKIEKPNLVKSFLTPSKRHIKETNVLSNTLPNNLLPSHHSAENSKFLKTFSETSTILNTREGPKVDSTVSSSVPQSKLSQVSSGSGKRRKSVESISMGIMMGKLTGKAGLALQSKISEIPLSGTQLLDKVLDIDSRKIGVLEENPGLKPPELPKPLPTLKASPESTSTNVASPESLTSLLIGKSKDKENCTKSLSSKDEGKLFDEKLECVLLDESLTEKSPNDKVGRHELSVKPFNTTKDDIKHDSSTSVELPSKKIDFFKSDTSLFVENKDGTKTSSSQAIEKQEQPIDVTKPLEEIKIIKSKDLSQPEKLAAKSSEKEVCKSPTVEKILEKKSVDNSSPATLLEVDSDSVIISSNLEKNSKVDSTSLSKSKTEIGIKVLDTKILVPSIDKPLAPSTQQIGKVDETCVTSTIVVKSLEKADEINILESNVTTDKTIDKPVSSSVLAKSQEQDDTKTSVSPSKPIKDDETSSICTISPSSKKSSIVPTSAQILLPTKDDAKQIDTVVTSSVAKSLKDIDNKPSIELSKIADSLNEASVTLNIAEDEIKVVGVVSSDSAIKEPVKTGTKPNSLPLSSTSPGEEKTPIKSPEEPKKIFLKLKPQSELLMPGKEPLIPPPVNKDSKTPSPEKLSPIGRLKIIPEASITSFMKFSTPLRDPDASRGVGSFHLSREQQPMVMAVQGLNCPSVDKPTTVQGISKLPKQKGEPISSPAEPKGLRQTASPPEKSGRPTNIVLTRVQAQLAEKLRGPPSVGETKALGKKLEIKKNRGKAPFSKTDKVEAIKTVDLATTDSKETEHKDKEGIEERPKVAKRNLRGKVKGIQEPSTKHGLKKGVNKMGIEPLKENKNLVEESTNKSMKECKEKSRDDLEGKSDSESKKILEEIKPRKDEETEKLKNTLSKESLKEGLRVKLAASEAQLKAENEHLKTETKSALSDTQLGTEITKLTASDALMKLETSTLDTALHKEQPSPELVLKTTTIQNLSLDYIPPPVELTRTRNSFPPRGNKAKAATRRARTKSGEIKPPIEIPKKEEAKTPDDHLVVESSEDLSPQRVTRAKRYKTTPEIKVSPEIKATEVIPEKKTPVKGKAKVSKVVENEITPTRRKRRNSRRTHSGSEGEGKEEGGGDAGRKRERNDAEVDVGGKRRKMKGKRTPDLELRRTIEEQKRLEGGDSSSDEDRFDVPEHFGGMSTEEDSSSVPVVITGEKKRGKPVSRGRGRARGKGKGRGTTPSAKTATESPAPSSDVPSDSSKPSPKKNKGSRILKGLDMGAELLTDDTGAGPSSGTPVRQSRRIAQIKIKEEAERRELEEMTLYSYHEEQRKKKNKKQNKHENSNEAKLPKSDQKKKKLQVESDEDYIQLGQEEPLSSKIKRKKRKKKSGISKFNELNPWMSSSGSSSSSQEEVEEDEEEELEPTEDESNLVFKSDHEFSPESDLEGEEGDIQLPRRARTAQKESDGELAEVDDHACQKCGKMDHPEWILLCDKCDNGWHGSCLRPALLVIPEGDWFCPPCEHTSLLVNLQERLCEYDRCSKRRENEELRRKRLAYVGISLDNVLPNKDKEEESAAESTQGSGDKRSSSSSQSGHSSGDESEPVYQLRERRQALFSYRFNEYDDLINSAIQDELEAVKGAGNQGRGKDIANIVNAEKDELASGETEKEGQEESKVEEEEEDEEEAPGYIPPVKPKYISLGKKKHRRLNSLDISSEDDAESDEDFKGTSSEEDEEDDEEPLDSDDSELGRRRSRRSNQPVRRSSRARTTRFDREFINDETDSDYAPKRKKTRRLFVESDSEESDDWNRSKRRKSSGHKLGLSHKSKSKKKKKKESVDDESGVESAKEKKPRKRKVKFGGLDSLDDVPIMPRTRGRKMNYQEMAGSDSEEEILKAMQKKLETEDEEFLASKENFDDEDGVKEDDKEAAEEEDDPEEEAVVQSAAIKKGKQERKPKQKKKGVRKPREKKPKAEKKLQRVKTIRVKRPLTPVESEEYDEEEEEEDLMPMTEEEREMMEMEAEAEEEERLMMEEELAREEGLMALEDEEVEEEEEEELTAEEAQMMVMLEAERVKKAAKEEKKRLKKEQKKLEKKEQKKRGKLARKLEEAQAAAEATAVAMSSVGLGGINRPAEGGVPAQGSGPIPPNLPTQSHVTPPLSYPHLMGPQHPMVPEMVQPPMPAPLDHKLEEGEIPIGAMALDAISPTKPKRRGRGRGKATIAAAAAAAAAAENSVGGKMVERFPPSPQGFVPQQPPQPGGSVITRMLQAQPAVSTQSFTAAAAAMGHKYFGSPTPGSEQPPARGVGPMPQVASQFQIPPRGRIPSPYRQTGPPPPLTSSPSGSPSMPPHYGRAPMGQMPPMRMRTAGLNNAPPPPQMYHTSHHPLDPSPSGGGPIAIASTTSGGGSSPLHQSPTPTGSPLSGKPGQNTPPPPPYARGPGLPAMSSVPGPAIPPPLIRYPADVGPPLSNGSRHPPQVSQFAPSGAPGHLQQPQPSPPQHPGRNAYPPYHPPPSYHYGAYPPPPPLTTADDAMPPTVYQGSPYPDHFSTLDASSNLQPSDNSNSKSYDEEGGGEFGGLVSYFSSQREDDLDT